MWWLGRTARVALMKITAALVVVLLTALPVGAQVEEAKVEEAKERESSGKLWWTVTALYGAGLTFMVLDETHKEPCIVPGCEPMKREIYGWGALATITAATALSVFEMKRHSMAVQISNGPGARKATVAYGYSW